MRKPIILLTLFLTACSSTPVRDELSAGLGEIPVQYSDANTIEEIKNLKPQAKFPLKVAVMPSGRWQGFTISERKIIKAWESELQEIGFIDTLQIVPQTLIPNCGYKSESDCFIKASRLSAARMRADAILFLNDSTVTDQYLNPLSILNLTIVGVWLAPGHHRDSYSIFEGALFDVNNGYLYAVAEGEGEYKTVRPYAYTDYHQGQEEARLEALKDLGRQLINQAKSSMLSKTNRLESNSK